MSEQHTRRAFGSVNHTDLAAMIEASPNRVIYGFTIKWTDFDGSRHEVASTGFHSGLDARRSVIGAARQAGWTPPRWWQWWRWNDTRPDMDGIDLSDA